jgi:4-amino-4-deoxy-L-arabinose transferase-like glycosyltransferase
VILPSRARRLPLAGTAVIAIVAIGALSTLWGALVAWRYHDLGLTLSHYDARGHLVVARRIFDSITPGWQQIGAVWLPLPHMLNAIPAQIDFFYRTGASAVAISIASFALATAAIAWIVMLLTGSALAAAAGAAVYALNPNVLYLQATPMTEPLLLGLTTLAVAMLIDWCQRSRHDVPETPVVFVGVAFALACLTRYEAWPVTGAALALTVWARWRAGDALSFAIRRVAAIALYPALTVLAFMLFSRIVVGEWFVSSGFFVPENTALGHPIEAVDQIAWGARTLSGSWLLVVAGAGFAVMVALGLLDKRRGEYLIAASLAATAAVPWAAFMKGHPYRIRYMVPLIVAEAIGAGIAAGLWKKGRVLTVAALAVLMVVELRPLGVNAPMVAEARWDLPNIAVRQRVTDCLRAGYDGQTIMASMGSLGHYMQDASHSGFALRDFLHEGNGDIWLAALDDPRPFAGWILIEEKAEGGDMLAIKARENPAFLGGFSRVCDGAGLALYRRKPDAAASLQNPMFSVSR